MSPFALRILRTGLVAAAALALAACDQERIAKLEEGISTETQVRQQFGEPVTVVTQADGSRIFEYPRQPEGFTNYFITLGPDGKLARIHQALKEENFAKVSTGMAQHDVRSLLGRPGKVTKLELKREEIWDWRFKTGPNAQQTRIFSATFDAEGRVTTTAITDDPGASNAGG